MSTPVSTSSTDSQMHNNIMAAGSKDRPPMLGPGRYSQWRSRFLRYIDTKINGEGLKKCILNGPYVPTSSKTSPTFTTYSNPLFDSNDDFTSSDDESLSDEDVPMKNFKIYSNPLFDDEEIISPKIDTHYFNFEFNLIESLLNRDILIDSSPKFDYLLEEFLGSLLLEMENPWSRITHGFTN
ncbi:hypothetical protein Tco_0526046 [Tanacetum coccineum]